MDKIIVIVGPTGVGKTKLSIALAKKLNGAIINADSRQIYKELNIGTAKITETAKENIPHYLFDLKSVMEDYSVFEYQQAGRQVISRIFKQKKTPIIVGGTGLYIKALLYDYQFKTEESDINFDDYNNEKLYKMVKEINPASNIHLHNRRRLINFLRRNNKLKNDYQGNQKLLYPVIFIGLTLPRDILYQEINARVDKMIKDGLIEEAKALYNQNINSKVVLNTIGYQELYQYFTGRITKEEAIALIKQNSRRYAKRQYTWFNNQMTINWFLVDLQNFNNTITAVMTYLNYHL
ncbi:MAG: tRNA (adenosine(37)-N6)-dimethylallyltransferase MiaA [Bacilli bacterium]|nr:tRNA (adenosine(37)-N6)-dimethylallyltransferase MiaA [Bacilli bacterium]